MSISWGFWKEVASTGVPPWFQGLVMPAPHGGLPQCSFMVVHGAVSGGGLTGAPLLKAPFHLGCGLETSEGECRAEASKSPVGTSPRLILPLPPGGQCVLATPALPRQCPTRAVHDC